jgi:6-phosphogluconolactonase (cycloisomerase 2 family)
MKYVCAVCFSLLLSAAAVAQNQFVYTDDETAPNEVSAAKINADGSLTQIAGSPFATGGTGGGGWVEGLATATAGKNSYLYVDNGGDGTISGLKIDPANGALRPVPRSPFLADGIAGNYSLAISPSNRFLFASSDATTLIHVYAISQTNGSLFEVKGSPFLANANLDGLKVSGNGHFLIAGGQSNSAVAVFSISQAGALTEVPGSPFPASGTVSAVESNCASNQVFAVSNSTNLIDAYKLSAAGTLTPAPGSPFSNGASGNGPNSFDLVLSPTNHFLFTTDSFTDEISSFAVAPDAALMPVAGSPFFASSWTSGTAITHAGDYLYAVDFSDAAVLGEHVNSDGSLTPAPGPFNTGAISTVGEMNTVITFPSPVCPTVSTQ